MRGSDLKFFFIIGIVAVAGYWWAMDGFKGKTWGVPDHSQSVPTVTFVPEGTPGAMTLEEYNKKRYGW